MYSETEDCGMAEWMTVKQVAEYLQMSDDKIYDMAKKGELPAVKIRQQWRFDREEIDQWLKDHQANREARSKR
jgi:PTS system nitrogen regulatory IIA component